MKFSYILLSFLLCVIYSCKSPEQQEAEVTRQKITRLADTTRLFDDRYFPNEKKPVAGKFAVFFTARHCPSCIIDIDNYVKVLKRNAPISVEFYTNAEIGNLGGIDKVLSSLEKVEVSPFFAEMKEPIIFETDAKGKIVSHLEIHASFLQTSFDFLKQRAAESLEKE